MATLVESLMSVIQYIRDEINNILEELNQTSGTVELDKIDEILAGTSTGEKVIRTIATYEDTNHTLSSDDVWKWVEMKASFANEFALPAITEYEPEVGMTIMVRQMGTGTTTITADSSLTILSPYDSHSISKRYASVCIQYCGSGVYCLEGAFAEA